MVPIVPAMAEVMPICGAQGVDAPSPGQFLWGDVENSDSLKEDGINLSVGPSVTRGEEGEIMEEEVSKVKNETIEMDSMGLTQEKKLEEECQPQRKKGNKGKRMWVVTLNREGPTSDRPGRGRHGKR